MTFKEDPETKYSINEIYDLLVKAHDTLAEVGMLLPPTEKMPDNEVDYAAMVCFAFLKGSVLTLCEGLASNLEILEKAIVDEPTYPPNP